MKFKVKPQPCFWDKKTVTRFAWFPIRVEDNIIWLEKYECTYRFERDSFWDYSYWELLDRKIINKQD